MEEIFFVDLNGHFGTPPEQRKELRILSDNKIYPGDDIVSSHQLFVDSGHREYGIDSPCPVNPLEISKPNVNTVLTITSSHNILIGSTVCDDKDFQFVIFADKPYQTTMTSEEYEIISAVIKRAVSK